MWRPGQYLPLIISIAKHHVSPVGREMVRLEFFAGHFSPTLRLQKLFQIRCTSFTKKWAECTGVMNSGHDGNRTISDSGCQMAMGENPNCTPSEHQPIPTKIGNLKWVVNSPTNQNGIPKRFGQPRPNRDAVTPTPNPIPSLPSAAGSSSHPAKPEAVAAMIQWMVAKSTSHRSETPGF